MDFLVDFEFYMAVLGVGMCPIGLVAPSGLKTLDSQPEKSNMGPASTNFHDFELFRKVATTLWPGIYRVFCLELSEINFRVFWSEPKRCATKSYAVS